MISSGGDFAKALAIRATEEAATGRPESAALIVAGLNLASLAGPRPSPARNLEAQVTSVHDGAHRTPPRGGPLRLLAP